MSLNKVTLWTSVGILDLFKLGELVLPVPVAVEDDDAKSETHGGLLEFIELEQFDDKRLGLGLGNGGFLA